MADSKKKVGGHKFDVVKAQALLENLDSIKRILHKESEAVDSKNDWLLLINKYVASSFASSQ